MSCTCGREYNKPNSWFSVNYIYNNKVCNTVVANDINVLFDEPRHLNKTELCRIGTFPLDYDFCTNKPKYIIGMSVPPVIIAQISSRIYDQWLSKLI